MRTGGGFLKRASMNEQGDDPGVQMKAVICSSLIDSLITLNFLVMLLKIVLTIIWC